MTDKPTTDLVKASEPDMVLQATAIERKLQDPQFVSTIRDMYFRGCEEFEIQVGLEHCRHLGLDPLAKEIWFLKIWDSDLRREVMTPITGIAGLRKAAHRTGDYAGPGDPQWCGLDGVWRDVWLDKSPPAAARVTVARRSFDTLVSGTVLYSAYVRTNKQGKPMARWAIDPAGMLAKCSEALALRRAFSQLERVQVEGVDRLETAEEYQIRIREDPQDVIKQLSAAQTRDELDELAAKAGQLPAEHKDAAREAWAVARDRVNDQARAAVKSKSKAAAKQRQAAKKAKAQELPDEPTQPDDHDYGPAPMTDAEVQAVESGEQSGFGFDGEGGAK